ncbi:hypothetical protein [Paenilisteria weihenstephanensis]|uniref:hypothetical protein n=1 Tax=Listeria weihenstephanensis TaxID=1006155 RepID=UPI00117EDF6F|nr:hypothetical protein [Listeria weihenstephanensis]
MDDEARENNGMGSDDAGCWKYLKEHINVIDADFLVLCTESRRKLLSQMIDYINRFPGKIEEADVHIFSQNPVFLQYMRKLSDEASYEMTEELLFLDEGKEPSVSSTYLENDPHILLQEMAPYILYKKSFLENYFEEKGEEEGMIDIFQHANAIWKHRVLEEVEENENNFDDIGIEEILSCWKHYRSKEEVYTSLNLELQDFDKNFLNYLIRNKLGPCFQKLQIEKDITSATRALVYFTEFLESEDKKLISGLVSIGYFYIQNPIENYALWHTDKKFSETYIAFLKILFNKSHYQTKQYYLKYYRRATNAAYKAAGLNSLKPVAKCYKLYYTH